MMDAKELDEIRKRADAATPGPWLITIPDLELGYTNGAVIWGDAAPAKEPGWVSHGINIGEMAPADSDYLDQGEIKQNSNGLFVAHARQDVPRLLDDVERLRAALEKIASAEPLIIDPELYGWIPRLALEALKGGE